MTTFLAHLAPYLPLAMYHFILRDVEIKQPQLHWNFVAVYHFASVSDHHENKVMHHVLVAGLCRHLYHGHIQGLAASFTQDQLAMLHSCLPEGCIAYAEEDVQVLLAVSCCGALSSKISSCLHQHTSCWHITYTALCVLHA